jgi:hypothetical protein
MGMNNQEPNEQKLKIEDTTRPERQVSSTTQQISIQSRPILSSEVSSNEPIVDGITPQPPSGHVTLPALNAPSTTIARNNNLQPVGDTSSRDLQKNDMAALAINVSDSATEGSQAEENTAPDGAQLQDTVATAENIQNESELQEYVKNRKYFVPVDIAGYKRSVKVSLWLVLLVILLGIVLLDLMLDTGMIYLVQNIPHTHFFNHLN